MRVRKLCALLLTAALCLALGACSGKDPVVGTVNGREVPFSEYHYYGYSMQQMYEANYNMTVQQLDEVSGEGSTVFTEMLRGAAFDYCVTNRLIEDQLSRMGIEDAAAEDLYVEQMIAYYIQSFGGEDAFEQGLEEDGLDRETMERALRYSAKQSILLNALYGPGAAQEITDAVIEQYYQEHYVRVQHILVALIDLETRAPLSDGEIAEKRALADDLLLRIESGEDFTALMNEYSEDTGLAAYPDGYTFDLDHNSYMPEFSALAGELAVDEVDVCETSYGIHIMKRFETGGSAADYASEITSQIQSDGLAALVDSLREDAEIVTDQAVYDSLTFY